MHFWILLWIAKVCRWIKKNIDKPSRTNPIRISQFIERVFSSHAQRKKYAEIHFESSVRNHRIALRGSSRAGAPTHFCSLFLQFSLQPTNYISSSLFSAFIFRRSAVSFIIWAGDMSNPLSAATHLTPTRDETAPANIFDKFFEAIDPYWFC